MCFMFIGVITLVNYLIWLYTRYCLRFAVQSTVHVTCPINVKRIFKPYLILITRYFSLGYCQKCMGETLQEKDIEALQLKTDAVRSKVYIDKRR